MDIEKMLGDAMWQQSKPIDLEAAMMRIEEVAALYAQPCPFKVGDWVTPRANGSVKGHGQPQLVIAVEPDAPYRFDGNPGSSSYGQRYDIRVMAIYGDNVVPFWCESASFVFYPAAETPTDG